MGPEKRALRTLATRLRELRYKRGWSQEELADRMDSDRTYISDMERGLRNPSENPCPACLDATNNSWKSLRSLEPSCFLFYDYLELQVLKRRLRELRHPDENNDIVEIAGISTFYELFRIFNVKTFASSDG